jgi:regulatory protein
MSRQDPNFKSAMAAALRLLTRRGHTRRELGGKLARRGFGAGTVDRVLADCERLKYLDDQRQARFYIDELQGKGYGSYFIQNAMRKKGFEQETIESAMATEEGEDAQFEAARRALKKKQRTFEREKDPRKRRDKQYRYLYSRGFSPSVISALIHR